MRLAAVAVAALAACRAQPPPHVPCSGDSECASGFHCASGACVGGERGPTLLFTRPAAAAPVRGTISVTVDAQDPDGVAEVRLAAGTAAPFAMVRAPPFEGQLNTLALPEGPLTLHAEAEDARGTLASAALDLTVDNTAPALAPFTLSASSVRWDQTLTVTFTASEPLSSLAVTVAGRAAAQVSQDGLAYLYSYRIHGDEPPDATLAAGRFRARAEAADAAGNAGSAQAEFGIDLSCEAGHGECDDDPTTGCETTLGTLTDCSGCDDACAAPHGTPTCACQGPNCGCAVAGCEDGWDNCTAAPGCETPLWTDANCSGCGDACALLPNTGSAQCGPQHTCEVVSCAQTMPTHPEWGNCTDAPGCETPLNTSTDCGGCGASCAFVHRLSQCKLELAQPCQVQPCTPGWADCRDDLECETDLYTTADCGQCGHKCMPIEFANAATCPSGTCLYTCPSGRHLCGAEGMTYHGCAADDDALHCGSGVNCGQCPDRANAIPLCLDGAQCSFQCIDGFHGCNATGTTGPPDACFADDDADHCGASCVPCSAPANANATCDVAGCGFICQAGFCRVGTSCEVVDRQNDDANCGLCGNACAMGKWCYAGLCRIIGEPILEAARTFGGIGDEYGTGLTVLNNALFFSGWGRTPDNAIAGRYNFPLGTGSPVWSHRWPTQTTAIADRFLGMTTGGGNVYVVGDSYSQTTDSVGLKEAKSTTLKYRLDAQSPGSEQYQPLWYSWWSNLGGASATEYLKGATVLIEGNPYLYAVGRAQSAIGPRDVIIKVKDPLIATLGEGATGNDNRATLQWTQYLTSNGNADAAAIAQLNASFYAVGGDYDDGTLRPIIARYSTSGLQQWVRKGTFYFTNRAVYTAVVAHNGGIYAAGHTLDSADRPQFFFIDRWEESGTRSSSLTYDVGGDATGPDELRAIVGIGTNLYAVGTTALGGAGGDDAVVVQVSAPSPTGMIAQGATYWGGAQHDAAAAAVTDGRDLFIAGDTRSSGAGGSDLALLHYRVTPTTALGYLWQKSTTTGYALLRTDTGLFNGTDCHPNSLPNSSTYNAVPFATGPKPPGFIGMRAYETYFANPGGPTPITAVYSVSAGGRYNAETHFVWFRYADGTQAACQVTVPQDNSFSSTSGQCATSVNIGSLSGGPCSGTGLQMQTFTNPSPQNPVAGFSYNWTDQSGGGYPGRVYALTVKVQDTTWSRW